jgi:glutathione-regulated potassium-efflux system ancillary protein KefG
MGRLVDIDDLVDARDVAHILHLSAPTSVFVYQGRYPDMPRPILDRGANRARLWLRQEIEEWAKMRGLPRDSDASET